MNNKDLLKIWLGDRRRKYADGVSLFMSLARPQVKERYGAFIKEGLGKVTDQFDGRFTMLVNLLASVNRDIPLQPSLYPAAFSPVEGVTSQVPATEEARDPEHAVPPSDQHLEETVSDLEGRVQENEDTVSDLEDRVQQHDEEIEDLQDQVDELAKPGVKIVNEASMPPHVRKCYARIKEIVPLYASLHADICSAATSDSERKKLADQLCDLDDERRQLWDKIDEWSEGKKTELEPERPKYSDDPVVRGFEYARAVKRLKENIRNSRASAEKAKQDGRTVVYENALRRIEGYEKELMEIESKMSSGL